MLIAQLRLLMEPMLHVQELQWPDVLPMLESVDSQEELQQALSDAEAQLKNLLTSSRNGLCFGSFSQRFFVFFNVMLKTY